MTSRSDTPMRVRLSDEGRERLMLAVRAFFRDELDHELSEFQTERLIAFFVRSSGRPSTIRRSRMRGPSCTRSSKISTASSTSPSAPESRPTKRPARRPAREPAAKEIGELTEWTIRHAEERDLPALVDIYNHYVEHSHVTFDLETLSVDDRRRWFDGFAEQGRYRLLVAEAVPGCEVVGYASSSQFRTKAAYHPSVESSVYLSPRAHRHGVGTRLYEALLEILRDERDVHRVYGGIALPNEASIALHERCGFDHVGTFREVGYKFGRYWDVAWYERDVA